jgi:molecular chaperone DnaK
MKPGPILGIDFGTTNTSAAFFDDKGKLRLVPVGEKNFVMPSIAWFHAGDKALVGQAARTQIVDDPRHTIFASKRFLGRRFQSEFVSRNREKFAYEIVEGEDGYCAFHVYGQVRPMTEVAYLVIKQMLTLANHAAGTQITECVLTVPVHASIRQREAVRYAAEKAGLQVKAMVNEPTAAALYYANLRNPHQKVLIFDLGGGTLDATLLAVEQKVVKVLATGGDAFLGGANFDEAIVDHLIGKFQEQHGIDLRGNTVVMQRLIFAAEGAKIALTKADRTRLRVPCITQKNGEFVHFDFVLTRQEMEQVCFQLIERSATSVSDVLEKTGLMPGDIDELVFVGGQTRMPAIRRRFRDFKTLSSEKDVNPELGVAVGAAILGRNLQRGLSGLSDVVPMPISVMLPGGASREVIPGNSPVPVTYAIDLENLPTWSAPVPILVFESLDSTSTDREVIGTIQVGVEWRVGSGGAPTLELTLGQDFLLKARLVAQSGHVAEVTIVDAKPLSRR